MVTKHREWTRGVAGAESDGQFQFTGIKKYFNSYTLTGGRVVAACRSRAGRGRLPVGPSSSLGLLKDIGRRVWGSDED